MVKTTAQLRKELKMLKGNQERVKLQKEISQLKETKKLKFAKATGRASGKLIIAGGKAGFGFLERLTRPPKRK